MTDSVPRDAKATEDVSPAATPTADEAKMCCAECRKPYSDPSWIEAVVSDEVWARISPKGDGGGVLCINCMASRAVKAGLDNVPIRITAGPFIVHSESEQPMTTPPADPVTMLDSLRRLILSFPREHFGVVKSGQDGWPTQDEMIGRIDNAIAEVDRLSRTGGGSNP